MRPQLELALPTLLEVLPTYEQEGALFVRSTEFGFSPSPVASFVTRVVQSGYLRRSDETYLKKSLPPLDFEYSQATVNDEVRDVDPESLQNLPTAADSARPRCPGTASARRG